MKRPYTFSSVATAIALACAAPLALAQTQPPPQDQPGVTHAPPFRTTPQAQGQQQLPARIPKANRSGNVKGRTTWQARCSRWTRTGWSRSRPALAT